jgi:tetratricopeptide (TPR) repeat protein
VLNATDSYREPDTAAQRVADGDLAVAVADRLGDPITRFHAWSTRHFLAILTADRGTSTRCLAVMAQIVEAVPLPSLAWPLATAQSVECLLDGDIAGAEAAADEALTIASNAQEPEALAAYGSVLLDIRRQQGRLSELLELFRQVAHDYAGLPVLEAVVAFIECEQGNVDEARAIFAPHVATSFELFPNDQPWSSAIGYCAEIAIALDDRPSAEILRRMLDPYRSLVAATTVSTQGAIARPLGRLALFLGDRAAAMTCFEEALGVNGRLGARYWSAETRLDFAELLANGDAAERVRAQELAAEGLTAARAYGYPALESRASSLLDSL